MERPAGRSTGVEQAIAASLAEAPADADAEFEALYRSSRDDVYAYAAGLLRDRAAAEDVTALAFERAYRKRRRFNPKRGSRRAWLFGIARNAALDELRRRRRSAELVGEPPDSGAAGRDRGDVRARDRGAPLDRRRVRGAPRRARRRRLPAQRRRRPAGRRGSRAP